MQKVRGEVLDKEIDRGIRVEVVAVEVRKPPTETGSVNIHHLGCHDVGRVREIYETTRRSGAGVVKMSVSGRRRYVVAKLSAVSSFVVGLTRGEGVSLPLRLPTNAGTTLDIVDEVER